MAENVTKDELEAKFTEGMEIVAHNMVAYGAKLSEAQRVEFNTAMAPVIAGLESVTTRMNAVDIIDSEDGIDTMLERLNSLNAQLESYGNLEEVLGNIDVLKADVDLLKEAVATAQSTADTAVAKGNANAQAIADLGNKTTEDIATAKSEAIADAETKIATAKEEALASVSDNIATNITPRLNKQREELNSLNGVVHDVTDEDGVVTQKGLTSRVTDLESKVIESSDDVKAYADENFLNVDSIKAMDLSKGDARMKEILGLGESDGDGETA